MPQIQLLDGKKIPFDKSISGFELVKKISKSFIMMYQYMFLSNYAIEYYQDEDYKNAYKYFLRRVVCMNSL